MSSPIIIFDQGSSNLKVGFSDDLRPKSKIPFVIGRPYLKFFNIIEDSKLKPLMIGDEVFPFKSYLELSYPIKNGIIKNKEDTAILWDYALSKKLGLDINDLKSRKILITDSLFSTVENKENMAEIIFEKFGLGFMNIEPRAKMILYGHGSETGVVVNSGKNNTLIIPIFYSHILHNKIKKLDITGKHITDYLTKLIILKGYPFHLVADFDKINELKKKYCFVSCNIDSDRKLEHETSYYNSWINLPDGRNIRLSNEKFEAPEILFNPYLVQDEFPGIHEILFNAIEVSK